MPDDTRISQESSQVKSSQVESRVSICTQSHENNYPRLYLHGRSQCVQIDGTTSEFEDLTCGVPQGSVLGPSNFCIYTYPLSSILRHHGINY